MHKLSLLNGWQRNTDPGDAAPSYTVQGGMVYLAGGMHRTTDGRARFAILPKAARPAHLEYITVTTYAGGETALTPGTLKINPGGVAQLYGNTVAVWLGGVAFPQASSASHNLRLVNGWESGQSSYGTGNPAYWVSGGVVHLSGSLIMPGAGQETFATLPPTARPKHSLYIKVYTYQGSVGTLYIQPNGTMQAYDPTATNAQKFTSLAGISFPVGS